MICCETGDCNVVLVGSPGTKIPTLLDVYYNLFGNLLQILVAKTDERRNRLEFDFNRK